MNNINFKAKYIKPIDIEKWEDNQYKPFTASFIEFEPSNNNDKLTLKKTCELWGKDSLMSYMNDDFTQDDFQTSNKHIYSITSQNNNYDCINPDKVLGAVEFIEDKKNNINNIIFLEVEPDNQALQMGKQNYKKIGTSILNCLKSLYHNKPIKLNSSYSAIKFYEKNNFHKDSSSKNKFDYIWDE